MLLMKIISVVHTCRLHIIIKRCCPTDDLVFKIRTHLLMELNTNFSTHAKPTCTTWLTVYTSEHLGLCSESVHVQDTCSETASPLRCSSLLAHPITYEYFEKRLYVIRMGNSLLFLGCLCIKITVLSIFLFYLLLTQSGIYFQRFERFRIIHLSPKNITMTNI